MIMLYSRYPQKGCADKSALLDEEVTVTIVAGCTVETVTDCSIVIQTGVGSGWTWSWDVRSGWTVGASWTRVLILGGARVVTVPTSTTVSCVRRKIKAISTYLSDINFMVSTNISLCL